MWGATLHKNGDRIPVRVWVPVIWAPNALFLLKSVWLSFLSLATKRVQVNIILVSYNLRFFFHSRLFPFPSDLVNQTLCRPMTLPTLKLYLKLHSPAQGTQFKFVIKLTWPPHQRSCWNSWIFTDGFSGAGPGLSMSRALSNYFSRHPQEGDIDNPILQIGKLRHRAGKAPQQGGNRARFKPSLV